MPSGYDRISFLYDGLARVVFGHSIIRAQQHGLSEIASGSKVLIIGGGTGFVLEYIAQLRLENLYIDYVEPSSEMINRAKKRPIARLSINFINQPIERIDIQRSYDVIITQFFLDSFNGKELEDIYQRLHTLLKNKGSWIIADFQLSQNWKLIWQKPLISAMYLFFTLTVGIKARRLEDFQARLVRLGYRLKTGKTYYASFIFSSSYQKME